MWDFISKTRSIMEEEGLWSSFLLL
jgi:hypothetical protein